MPRYIDADELIKAIHDEWDEVLVWDESGERTAVEFERLVDLAPTIEARKKGKWIEDGYYNLPAVCCYCGEVGKRFWNFCPSCGTDMRGKEDAEVHSS